MQPQRQRQEAHATPGSSLSENRDRGVARLDSAALRRRATAVAHAKRDDRPSGGNDGGGSGKKPEGGAGPEQPQPPAAAGGSGKDGRGKADFGSYWSQWIAKTFGARSGYLRQAEAGDEAATMSEAQRKRVAEMRDMVQTLNKLAADVAEKEAAQVVADRAAAEQRRLQQAAMQADLERAKAFA